MVTVEVAIGMHNAFYSFSGNYPYTHFDMNTQVTIDRNCHKAAMILLLMLLTTFSALAQHSPSKSFDICDGYGGYIDVRGWAFDPDLSASSIDVRVDVYSNSNCTDLYKTVTLTANKARADVNNKYHITGQHGFRSNIEVDATGNYWVRITALDATGDADAQLGTQTATVSGWTDINSSNAPTTWTTGTYKVTEDVSISSRITVSGDVTLFLGENTTLTCGRSIMVFANNKLTIDGTGYLVATAIPYSAAIGANGHHDPTKSGCGEIVINNGHITATGGVEAAAIGGSGYRCEVNSSCRITINGGVIHATGGKGAAAIGGGMAYSNYAYYADNLDDETAPYLLDTDGMPGTVFINGGQVTAIATDPTINAIGRGSFATGNTGSVILGWTNPTDYIYATRLDVELLSIAEGKAFVIDGTGIEANTDNLTIFNNGTLRPKAKAIGSATVSGISPAYTNRGEDFMPAYTVTDAFGTPLTEGIDFTAALTCEGTPVAQLNSVGNYTLTLTGTGQYVGTRTFNIEVQEIVAPPLVPSPGANQEYHEHNAIRQTAYTATSATLEWSDVNADVTTWKLEYSKHYRFDPAYAPVHELTVNGTPTVTITGLDPETSYYARVKAVNYGVESDWGGNWRYNSQGQVTSNGSTRFETTANNNWMGFGKHEYADTRIDDYFIPICNYIYDNPYRTVTTQQIYTADEIGRTGYINSLSFRMEAYRSFRDAERFIIYEGLELYNERMNYNPLRTLDVYIVQTDKSSFNDHDDMISYTAADLVWSGQLETTPDSWNTITFSTPFPYDGRHNIAVIIIERDTKERGYCGFYCYHTDKPQALISVNFGKALASDDNCYANFEDINTLGNPIKNQMRFGISSLDLADQTDNSSVINNNDGQTLGITLNDRTIYRDGDWNTLCLPFNLGDANAAQGHHFDGTEFEGATVMELDPATSNLTADGTLTLNFTDAASIEAGKPYIVKWNPANYSPRVQDDCRLITSEADWDAFASNPNTDAVLTADITVTTMAGGFSGTFDGNGHIITFNCGSAESPCTDTYCALFSQIDGATIKNLHVTGNIYNKLTNFIEEGKFAGGLAGLATGHCTIANCHVSTNVTGVWNNGNFDDEFILYNGGIIGCVGYEQSYNVIKGDVSITDCLFDGQLNGTDRGIAGCKGFVGYLYDNTCTATVTRSLFDPSAVTVLPSYAATFAVGGKFFASGEPGTATLTDCYYTQPLGLPQGTDASSMSANELTTALGNQWTNSSDKAVPILNPGCSFISWSNPTFGPYQIEGDAPVGVTTNDGKCTFQGSYDPFVIDYSNIDEIIYLGSNNTIGYASAPRTLRAFRAHFVVPTNGGSHNAPVRQVLFNDGVTTTVIPISDDVKESDIENDAWYTIYGIKLNSAPTQQGLYIHNGKTYLIK